MSLDLENITLKSREIILKTGDFIRAELGKVGNQAIEEKEKNSLVSYVDKTAESRLVNGLGSLLPAATFLTEEDTVINRESELLWIIDPLDGTTNFLHQIPCFAISVALQQEGKTVVGIVYEVSRDECFYAWTGSGAFLNGQAVNVSTSTRLDKSLLATGFPYTDYDYIKPYFEVLRHLMFYSRGIRRMGAAAVDLAYVACGRFDAFFEYSLNPWDVAAGALIVQEAGGLVTGFTGRDNYLHGREIIASNTGIFEEVLGVIKKEFGSRKSPGGLVEGG